MNVSSADIIKRWTFIIAEIADVLWKRRSSVRIPAKQPAQRLNGQYKNKVMPEIKDLLPEEVTELKELSDRYSNIVRELGEKDLEIFELEEKLDQFKHDKKLLLSDYISLKVKNEELTTKLIDKYGEGKINLETAKIELF